MEDIKTAAKTNLKTSLLRIDGMICINCRNRIEEKLKSTVGVKETSVNYNSGTASVTWNPQEVSIDGIRAAVESLDYKVLDDSGTLDKAPVMEIAGTLVVILSLYVLLRGLGVSAVTAAFPLAEAGMGYGMLFVIGLITSVHCVAMCGGINLSQCLRRETPFSLFSAPVLYNAGRVISYTVTGAIVGALGSVFSVTGRFQGIVQLTAGVFMVIMGINMLGFFPVLRRFLPRLPKIFVKKIDEQKSSGKNPFIIGLLNGLMPCGPLQAMQLYALSTGSPIAGGVSMFIFSMGTVPLMFGIGALSSLLSKKFARNVMRIGAMLVTVMGMTMFTYGWGLGGLPSPIFAAAGFLAKNVPGTGGANNSGTFVPVIENGVQVVNSTLNSGRYPAITVQRGIPVKWTITAQKESINGCNNRMIIREYGIEYRFKPGENVVEFTPERSGKFSFSCWMGMIRGSISVVEAGQSAEDLSEPLPAAAVPAGVSIPAGNAALAEIEGAFQSVAITLRDDGIEPAVIVLQRNVPAVWTINNDSFDAGNNRLIFPAYYTRLDIGQGKNVIQLMPAVDFDFSTGDNVFYGFVKVVDDLKTADIEAIKTEAENFETMIYPDEYFETAGQGGCCGASGS